MTYEPTRRQWDELLAELKSLVNDLDKHSRVARARSKERVIDGYPTNSMPESSIASGRTADPTAYAVERLAGGQLRETESGEVTTPDHWKGPKDEIAIAVNRMQAEAVDARNRLRGSVNALRAALPLHLADKTREQCVNCGIGKHLVTDWVPAESRCGSCSRRKRRYRKTEEVAVIRTIHPAQPGRG